MGKRKLKKLDYRYFLKPSGAKVIFTVLLLFIIGLSVLFTFLSYDISPVVAVLVLPAFILGFTLQNIFLVFVFQIVYLYLIVCLIVFCIHRIAGNLKISSIPIYFIVFIVLFFIGFINPILVSQIQYDTSCSIDSDCEIQNIGRLCPNPSCVTKANTEITGAFFDFIPGVHALSCAIPMVVACKCQQNVCTNIDFTKPSTLKDCDYASSEDTYYDGSTQRDFCLHAYGTQENEISVCLLIENGGKNSECVISVASNLGDHRLCDNIEANSVKEECISSVAISTNDDSLCELISSLSDSCFNTIAINTNDEALCRTDSCYDTIAIKTHSYALCKSNSCLDTVAVNTVNEKICQSDSCFNDVALLKGNAEICKNMENGWDQCLINVRHYDFVVCYSLPEVKETNCIIKGQPEEESIDYDEALKLGFSSSGWEFVFSNNGKAYLNPRYLRLYGYTDTGEYRTIRITCTVDMSNIPPGGGCGLKYFDGDGSSPWVSFELFYNDVKLDCFTNSVSRNQFRLPACNDVAAIETKDPTLCNSDYCYDTIAINTNDETI